jgi:hypothetical protein
MSEQTKGDAKADTKGPGEARPPRFEIRTPHAGFTGERGGVRFVDGVGTTDDESAAIHCADCGYKVTDRRAKK